MSGGVGPPKGGWTHARRLSGVLMMAVLVAGGVLLKRHLDDARVAHAFNLMLACPQLKLSATGREAVFGTSVTGWVLYPPIEGTAMIEAADCAAGKEEIERGSRLGRLLQVIS